MEGKTSKPKAQATSPAKPRTWNINVGPNETNAEVVARKLNSPFNRHGLNACAFQTYMASGLPEDDRPNLVDYSMDFKAKGEAAAAGDLTLASHLLMSQAISLDTIFTEMARRAANNMDTYVDATDRYMRMALKAQANSRATLEALAKLHQPREQTVRHVHVNQGGQAVIAEEFHHHTGGQGNGQSAEQPHTAGTGAAGGSTALPGPNQIGDSVPGPSGEGEPALPHARRQGKRRSAG